MASTAASVNPRNTALQVLRGLAAGSVLLYHAAHYTDVRVDAAWLQEIFNGRFGYYGVLTFFVLSGFLMEGAFRRYDARTFLMHRVVRLYPTYWLLFLGVYLAQSIRLLDFGAIPWQALTLLPLGEMYRPLSVEWTLMYEVFFYAVCAVLCLRRGLYPWVMLGWLLLVTYVALFRHEYGTVMQPTLVQIPFSLWNVGFICGGLAGVINRRWTPPDSALLCLVASVLVLFGMASSNVPRMYLDSFGIACLIVALRRWQPSRDSSEGLGFRSLFLLGEYSYGLYLVHAISIQIALQYVSPDADPLTTFAGMLGVGIAVGVVAGLVDINLYRRLKLWVDSWYSRPASVPKEGTG